ncbi:UPF0016-domain-containing protein [Laetiporus sulphureus 93-53]|uniref:GDT1 family protein n=1 Tax=Laetiporus sulphureus 93-53 TaxID=1314785 RepID=A0A165BEP5_9APHY|nr:UPF0016-domain-containing protein [Laetiporus sulphureus 93-53]KZT00891.1 UPF0016-domain-containing protein [Laetiporus sulphureus 93-53]
MALDDTAPELDEGAFRVFVRSFAMIIVSEIGDKTFLIAAILAMRHPRLVVFLGALCSLVVMSFLSAELGNLLPTLIPKRWTQACAAVLFLVFGVKMMQEGRSMRADKLEEEMKEAEEDIEGDEAMADGTGIVMHHREDVIPLEEIEEGGRPNGHRRSISVISSGSTPNGRMQSRTRKYAEALRNFFSLFLGPVFVQAFVLTFLGEWGDRSQISTIALAAAHNVYLVTIGTVIGHSMCTALAVIGGRYVSTKISVKHVTLAGSMLFLAFGLLYLYEAFLSIDTDSADFNPAN